MRRNSREKVIVKYSPGYFDQRNMFLFEQVMCDDGQYAYCEAYFVRGERDKFVLHVQRPAVRYLGVDENGYEINEVALKKLPWPPIPKPPVDRVNEDELWQEIYDYVYQHIDFSEKEHYALMASWIMATWIPEKFNVVPYLFFIGPLNSGKTRCLEVLWQLSYRGLMSTSIRPAGLFRACEAWHPTIILDEAEIYNRSDMLEVMALLNAGYRRGQCAIRVEKVGENKLELGLYDVFGFKAVACTTLLAPTFQSRCFIINMSRAVRQVKIMLDFDWAANLRSKLLRYRIQKLIEDDFNVTEDQIVRIGENGRLTELFIAPLAVTPADVKQNLIKYGESLATIIREEERTTIEAEVIDAIIKCKDLVEKNKLPLQTILDQINMNRDEKDQMRPTQLGKILKKLGFKKMRMSNDDSRIAIKYDEKLIVRLARRYIPSSLDLFLSSHPVMITPEKVMITSDDKTMEVMMSDGNTEKTLEKLSFKRWIITLIEKHRPEGIEYRQLLNTCALNGLANPDPIIEELIDEGKLFLERRAGNLYLKLMEWNKNEV
ncbi:hypothetical protein DRJ17_04600 [Candidatus Woesearchaeota archaeon]|nr:MAG: hypothetical protein DRJ17_04600 [Candidatus Woesearchaeota archaeon]